MLFIAMRYLSIFINFVLTFKLDYLYKYARLTQRLRSESFFVYNKVNTFFNSVVGTFNIIYYETAEVIVLD